MTEQFQKNIQNWVSIDNKIKALLETFGDANLVDIQEEENS